MATTTLEVTGSIRLADAARTRLIFVALFAVALVPLLTVPMLPFIDLYNHLARFYVLGHLDVSAPLRANYASNWAILPNIGLDVIGMLLLRLVPPQYAAHIIVVAIFAVQYGGVLAFNRVLTGRSSTLVALLLVPLLYSFILNWGFINFLLGLGLVFWGAAWWIAKRDQPLVAVPVACGIAVAIFLCHGLTFALYGIFLGALELGFYLQRPDRHLSSLASRAALLAVQAIVPVALFLHSPLSQKAGGISNADDAISHLIEAGALSHRLWDLLCYRLLTIVRVAEGPTLWFDIASFAVIAGLLGILFARKRIAVVAVAWPALIVGAILVALTPPALFGVGYVADRMPLFLALTFVGSLTVSPIGIARERTIVAALALLIALRLALIGGYWQQYSDNWQSFKTVAARIPPGAMVTEVVVGGSPRDGDDQRCAMYRPLMISLYGAIGPLFADGAAQPLLLTGPLHKAMTAMPQGLAKGDPRPGFYDKYIDAAGPAGFDYLLVCNADRLLQKTHRNTEIMAVTPRITLLRLSSSPAIARLRH